MGISGYEVFVMSTTSPFLLSIPSFRSLVILNVRTIHLLSLSGLLAYLIQNPVFRLLTVGFAVASSCLTWVATWYGERSNPARLESRILAWGMGLLVSNVAKFACKTNNPIWPIMHPGNGGWNKTALVIAIFSVLRSTRRTTTNADYFG